MPKDKFDERLNELLKSLGKNIENRLNEIGMTRKELAKKTGVSQNSVSGYIRGTQLPKFDTLCNISIALETSVSELTGGDVQNLQTKEIIEKAKKQAVKEYQIEDATQIFQGIGFESHRLENGEWQLFRQKTIDDFLTILTDGVKVKYLSLPNDDTLITLSQTVKSSAIQALNANSAMKELSEKLDKQFSITE